MDLLFEAIERPESAQIDENASLDGDEFGLALRLMQRAWPDDEMKAGAAEVSGHGHARGRVSEEEARFAQIDADGDGRVRPEARFRSELPPSAHRAPAAGGSAAR